MDNTQYIQDLHAWANSRVAEYNRNRSVPIYEKVREFPSSSSSAVYRVWRIMGTKLRCECPGYVFRKTCKHIREVEKEC